MSCGAKERDDTKAEAASAKVVPLWPASIRDDLPTATSNGLPGASSQPHRLGGHGGLRPGLGDKSSGSPRSCSRAWAPATLQIAESTWPHQQDRRLLELVDQNGTVLGLIVAIDGRLVLAPTSWSRREVLAAGGAVLLAPFAGRAPGQLRHLEAPPLSRNRRRPPGWTTSCSTRARGRQQRLRERAESLAKQYDLAASTSLLPAAGECIGQVTFLRKQAPDGPVLRELQVTEAQLATLMGQLVWDASQRRDHATAVGYYDQAISAANRAGETTAEAYARLRKSYVALYGEHEPQAGCG